MKSRKFLFTTALITIAIALVISGCGNGDDENIARGEISGSVSIPAQVALGGTVTANTSAVVGGSGAFSYAWEYGEPLSGDDIDWVPLDDTEDFIDGRILTLDPSYFDEGNFIRVKVSRAGRDGTLTSNTAEILDITITGVTISIAGDVNKVIAGTNYQLSAEVIYSAGSAEIPEGLFQNVTWDIAELPKKDDVTNAALNLTPLYINNTGVLKVNDKWAVNTLTITATSSFNLNIKSTPLSLSVDWVDFYQMNPKTANVLPFEGPSAGVGKFGFTILDGGSEGDIYTYFVDKGLHDHTSIAAWENIVVQFIGDWDEGYSKYAKMQIELAFDESMKNMISFTSNMFSGPISAPADAGWLNWWFINLVPDCPFNNSLWAFYPGLPQFITINTDCTNTSNEGAYGSYNYAKETFTDGINLLYLNWYYNKPNGFNDKVYFRNLRFYK